MSSKLFNLVNKHPRDISCTKLISSLDNDVRSLTSAVGHWIVPASSFQAAEAGRANQFIGVHAAKHNLSTHQEVAALSVTKIWRSGILALHWCWEKHSQVRTILIWEEKVVWRGPYNIGILLPVQFLPSPVYGWIHVQVYEPSVFRHLACPSQSEPRAHSSTSGTHTQSQKYFFLCLIIEIQINTNGTTFT